MVKASVTASRSVVKPSNKNKKIVKAKNKIAPAPKGSKKALKAEDQVGLQNNAKNIAAAPQGQKSKLNGKKITPNKKTVKQLTCQPVTPVKKRQNRNKRCAIKVKWPKSQVQAPQQTNKKRNKSKVPYEKKLKAAIDKTQALNNNGEWSIFNELKKEDKQNILLHDTATPDTSKTNLKSSAVELQNIKEEIIDLNDAEVEVNPELARRAVDVASQKVNMDIQEGREMVSETNERTESNYKESIKRKPPEKSKGNHLVTNEKTKFSDNVLGQLGRGEATPNSSLSSEKPPDKAPNHSVKTSYSYLNYKNSNKHKHRSSDKGSTCYEFPANENAEHTQDEDALDDEINRVPKKKRKVSRIKKSSESSVEEDALTTARKASYAKSIDEAIKKICAESSEKNQDEEKRNATFELITDNIRIVEDTEDTRKKRKRSSMETSIEQPKKNRAAVNQNMKFEEKVLFVNLEEVRLNKQLCQKYNVKKLGVKRKATSTLNPSTTSNTVSPSFNSPTSSIHEAPSKPCPTAKRKRKTLHSPDIATPSSTDKHSSKPSVGAKPKCENETLISVVSSDTATPPLNSSTSSTSKHPSKSSVTAKPKCKKQILNSLESSDTVSPSLNSSAATTNKHPSKPSVTAKVKCKKKTLSSDPVSSSLKSSISTTNKDLSKQSVIAKLKCKRKTSSSDTLNSSTSTTSKHPTKLSATAKPKCKKETLNVMVSLDTASPSFPPSTRCENETLNSPVPLVTVNSSLDNSTSSTDANVSSVAKPKLKSRACADTSRSFLKNLTFSIVNSSAVSDTVNSSLETSTGTTNVPSSAEPKIKSPASADRNKPFGDNSTSPTKCKNQTLNSSKSLDAVNSSLDSSITSTGRDVSSAEPKIKSPAPADRNMPFVDNTTSPTKCKNQTLNFSGSSVNSSLDSSTTSTGSSADSKFKSPASADRTKPSVDNSTSPTKCKNQTLNFSRPLDAVNSSLDNSASSTVAESKLKSPASAINRSPLNNFTSSTSRSPLKPIAPPETNYELPSKINKSCVNIRITRNVAADTTVISCVPLPNINVPVDTTGDVAGEPLQNKPVPDEDDYVSEYSAVSDSLEGYELDDFYRQWNQYYEFSDVDRTKVESSNGIFENAVFCYEATADDKKFEPAPVSVTKPVIPIITRTVQNTYAINNMGSPVKDSSGLSQKSASSGSHTSRCRTPVDSDKILEQRPASVTSTISHSSYCSDSLPEFDGTLVRNDPSTSSLNPQKVSTPDVNQPSSSQAASKKLEDFKIPRLPPAKRPAGFRLKSLGSTLKIQPETSIENDDILSLIASSISSFNNLEEEIAEKEREYSMRSPLKTEDFEEQIQQQDIQKTPTPSGETPPLCIDEEFEATPPPEKSLTSSTSNNSQNNVEQWLAKISDVDPLPVKVPSTATTPFIFRWICHYHFTKKGCRFSAQNCKRVHSIHNLGLTIRTLSYEQLLEAYFFTTTKSRLYAETFYDFVSALESLNRTPILKLFVNDILNIEIYNKTPLIEKIVWTLCKSGVPCMDVIEDILKCSNKNASLPDILLDIVCRDKPNLYNNWLVVQYLMKQRTEKVDRGLVEEIMTMCVEENLDKLAAKVVQDFVAPKMVDLISIDVVTLRNFLSVLEFHKTEKKLLEIDMALNNISVIPPSKEQSSASVENANKNNHCSNIPVVNSAKETSVLSNNDREVISSTVAAEKSHSYPGSELAARSNPNSHYHSEPDFRDSSQKSNAFKEKQPATNRHVTNTETHNGGNNNYNANNPNFFSPVSSDGYSEIGSSDQEANSHVSAKETPELELTRVPARSTTSRSSTSSLFIENPGQRRTEEGGETIDAADLKLLQEIVERGNNFEFFKMLGKFKDTSMSRTFIWHTLVSFETKTPEAIYEMFFPIISGIANLESNFRNDDSLTSMLHMLSANLLGLLERLTAYDKASSILLQYRGKYDKLCNSPWFRAPHRYCYSEIGKYLYLCKVLVKGDHLAEAWNILTSPDLKLLYGMNKWLLEHFTSFDNKFRNQILDDLVNQALERNILFAKDVILYIINDNNIVREIDIWKYYNQLLLNLLDSEEYTKELESMIENIIEGWYKYLYPAVMRGLLVRLGIQLSEPDALELYDKCCRRGCYRVIHGNERKLYFTTNMVEVEIYMTFHVFMHKKIRNIFHLENITLIIRSPDAAQQLPRILNPCVQDVRSKIAAVLGTAFPFTVCINYGNADQQCIDVQRCDLEPLFNYYLRLKQKRKASNVND